MLLNLSKYKPTGYDSVTKEIKTVNKENIQE